MSQWRKTALADVQDAQRLLRQLHAQGIYSDDIVRNLREKLAAAERHIHVDGGHAEFDRLYSRTIGRIVVDAGDRGIK